MDTTVNKDWYCHDLTPHQIQTLKVVAAEFFPNKSICWEDMSKHNTFVFIASLPNRPQLLLAAPNSIYGQVTGDSVISFNEMVIKMASFENQVKAPTVISIQISGPAKCGKSIIARLIQDTLETNDIKCENIENIERDPVDSERAAQYFDKLRTPGKIKVEIDTTLI